MLPCLRRGITPHRAVEIFPIYCQRRRFTSLTPGKPPQFEDDIVKSNIPEAVKDPSTSPKSIFQSAENAWDFILKDDAQHVRPIRKVDDAADEPHSSRRQTMTERESKVVTDMLDMIFNKRKPDAAVLPQADTAEAGGFSGKRVDDLVSRLRRHTKPLRWAKEPTADLLDQRKEEMLNCTTDQALLEWAHREVFGTSQRYEAATVDTVERKGDKDSPPSTDLPMLQSPIYPKVIAHLMRTFRDHYRDPNLALSIFHHAQKLSVVSYVFGCSTESYNELIQTRWSCFRDLQGVYNAVQEMIINGVPVDDTTRKLVETVRRDIGDVEMQFEVALESHMAVNRLLGAIEQLIASNPSSRTKKPDKVWDGWKSDILTKDATEGDWAFNKWESDAKEAMKSRQRSSNVLRALTKGL